MNATSSAWVNEAESILVPECLVPVQQTASRRRTLFNTGTHRLMIAVLEDAVLVYRKAALRRPSRKTTALVAETAAWFTSGERTSPFDFERICEVFDLDAEAIRRAVLTRTPAGVTERKVARHYAAAA